MGLVDPNGEDLGPGRALLHVGRVRVGDEPLELFPGCPREVRGPKGVLGHPLQVAASPEAARDRVGDPVHDEDGAASLVHDHPAPISSPPGRIVQLPPHQAGAEGDVEGIEAPGGVDRQPALCLLEVAEGTLHVLGVVGLHALGEVEVLDQEAGVRVGEDPGLPFPPSPCAARGAPRGCDPVDCIPLRRRREGARAAGQRRARVAVLALGDAGEDPLRDVQGLEGLRRRGRGGPLCWAGLSPSLLEQALLAGVPQELVEGGLFPSLQRGGVAEGSHLQLLRAGGD